MSGSGSMIDGDGGSAIGKALRDDSTNWLAVSVPGYPQRARRKRKKPPILTSQEEVPPVYANSFFTSTEESGQNIAKDFSLSITASGEAAAEDVPVHPDNAIATDQAVPKQLSPEDHDTRSSTPTPTSAHHQPLHITDDDDDNDGEVTACFSEDSFFTAVSEIEGRMDLEEEAEITVLHSQLSVLLAEHAPDEQPPLHSSGASPNNEDTICTTISDIKHRMEFGEDTEVMKLKGWFAACDLNRLVPPQVEGDGDEDENATSALTTTRATRRPRHMLLTAPNPYDRLSWTLWVNPLTAIIAKAKASRRQLEAEDVD